LFNVAYDINLVFIKVKAIGSILWSEHICKTHAIGVNKVKTALYNLLDVLEVSVMIIEFSEIMVNECQRSFICLEFTLNERQMNVMKKTRKNITYQ
jgi:hypothetical protein